MMKRQNSFHIEKQNNDYGRSIFLKKTNKIYR
jgi:hypothetical protein